MKRRQIGAVIKEVAAAKNLKVSKLAEKSGKNRQAIYMTFGRSEMTNEEIAEWANVLDISQDELVAKWNDDSPLDGKGDANYLMVHLTALEEQFKRLLSQLEVKDKQLEVKDQQMAGLQKTVDVLLGKSDVIEDVTCRVLNSLSGQMVA